MKTLNNILGIIAFFLISAAVYSHGVDHHFSKSKGGPLLKGYPWGIYGINVDHNKRVKHKENDQEIELANRIFENIEDDVQVAFPLKLSNMGYKPFGDGQSNGHADMAGWSQLDPPYLARLNSKTQELEISFHKSIQTNGSLTIRFSNNDQSKINQSAQNEFKTKVDINALGWNSLKSGKTIYIKPSHWGDWFALKFQKPYVANSILANGIPSHLKQATAATPNPLKIDARGTTPALLQLMEKYHQNKFLLFTKDMVHSIYPSPNSPDKVFKTSGGNWTFLLDPKLWEHYPKQTFKQLYSCFQGRAYWEEAMKKTVSGTSWHHVGDNGEIILNSIKNEDRSLVTAIGENVTSPAGVNLAYGLDDVGYATKLKPGNAFISVKGNYHWHPIHTTTPICVEVWTPICEPSKQNAYGFNCP